MSLGGDGIPGINLPTEVLHLAGNDLPFIPRRFRPGGRFNVIDAATASRVPIHTCVLCGGVILPEDPSNYEHAFPRWVHRLAGEVGEQKSPAIAFQEGPTPTWRQLEIAAHTSCNSLFAKHIENPARTAITAMVNGGVVTSMQIDSVLDWLDKVRSSSAHMATAFSGHGLVLGYNHGAFPNWRIGRFDRTAIFFRIDRYQEALDLWDCMDRGFLFTPGALVLRIKNLVILTISGGYILSPAFGLGEYRTINGQLEWVDGSGTWAPGFGSRISRLGVGLTVAQPMRRQDIKSGVRLISRAITEAGDGHVYHLEKDKWSRTKSIDFSRLPTLSYKLGGALASLEAVEWLMLIKELDYARLGSPANFGAIESLSDLRDTKMMLIDIIGRERFGSRPVDNDRL